MQERQPSGAAVGWTMRHHHPAGRVRPALGGCGRAPWAWSSRWSARGRRTVAPSPRCG